MTPRLVAVPVAAALALGACGGVSTDDFAADLDEVCVELEEETREIADAPASDPGELSRQLDRLRAAIGDAVERMRDLDRPDGDDGETAERYVDAVERAIDHEVLPALDELEAAVRARNEAGIRAASERLQAIDEQESQRLAEELGADACAEDRSV